MLPHTPRALLECVEGAATRRSLLQDYQRLLGDLPAAVAERVKAAWGDPADDPDCRDGAFSFRAARFGTVLVALPPDRGRTNDRRAAYHDPALPPRHALVAFGLWLRHRFKADALVHMGAHGTLEWLPGKAVALTASCFPEALTGPLPVLYPFLVSNPGEAAQAKRRIAGITIGHLPPPLVEASLSGAAQELERLVDEYAIADGLDRRRRERLARLIIDSAATQRTVPRSRRRERPPRGRGSAQDRCLAVRPQGPRHQGRASRLWPRRSRSRRSGNGRRAPVASARL